MDNCNISITNSEYKVLPDLIKCGNGAEYSATSSATMVFDKGVDTSNTDSKDGDVELNASYSGKINFAGIFILPKIKCNKLVINMHHTAEIHIYEVECSELVLNLDYASTLTIDKGTIGSASGTINHVSAGICHASISGANSVSAINGSRWVT